MDYIATREERDITLQALREYAEKMNATGDIGEFRAIRKLQGRFDIAAVYFGRMQGKE